MHGKWFCRTTSMIGTLHQILLYFWKMFLYLELYVNISLKRRHFYETMVVYKKERIAKTVIFIFKTTPRTLQINRLEVSNCRQKVFELCMCNIHNFPLLPYFKLWHCYYNGFLFVFALFLYNFLQLRSVLEEMYMKLKR